ncbi:hypothetical protein TRAPUB_6467 [Trametes pubescens]|uniref:Uncharacterized protein n=1 Tax=Trametes pubescens TaxID=154538 RepID=A0A1M2V5W4_TRAPU|nr:hypothetical protein TRAPUB_6467 [Trametes pubescens]
MYVRGWYIAGKKGRTRVKMPSSIPKTAALKTSAVMNVDVDALVAFDALVEDLKGVSECAYSRLRERCGGALT